MKPSVVLCVITIIFAFCYIYFYFLLGKFACEHAYFLDNTKYRVGMRMHSYALVRINRYSGKNAHLFDVEPKDLTVQSLKIEFSEFSSFSNCS